MQFYIDFVNNPKFKIKRKLARLNIIVIRISKTGKLANSKPCKKCIKVLKMMGLKNVIYSTGDDSQPIMIEKISKISTEHTCSMDKYNYSLT